MTVKFIPSGRGKAKCPPDPDYPQGRLLKADIAEGIPCCRFDLPYPAPECGMFEVHCDGCGMNMLVSAAGRPDDPFAIVVPCEMKGGIH